MPKLIFVYKKEEGFINGIFDFFHKLMKPLSYSCTSCVVTHNYTGMRKAWKSYLEWLPVQSDFFDNEQFAENYTDKEENQYPCVYLQHDNDELEEIISAEDLKEADLTQLTVLLNERVVSCKVKIS